MVRRSHLILATVGAAVSLAPAASAATVTVSPSARQVIGGTPLSVKVTSDTAGEIVIRQARSGSQRNFSVGCYPHDGVYENAGWIGGAALKTINYATPGVPVTVKLNSGQLGFFGGDLLSSLRPKPKPGTYGSCYDPLTQFTRISAWQLVQPTGYSVGYAPLVRLI